ncbi:zinc metalloendopeptidase, M23 family [Geotalea daltonii FRC-32]|uniref:Zinc metalloendopeptidase, M23 family n=1 Tax=Geotalea daltonii (strain DSM 22248 / JCM 15807 / FRC-32) TaxID=316067 RepID=B9M0Q7_GEODF|nr:M23 family metallopeptidase [Geotalea daltonii]ACM20910.1 zinc metalloendopeptidase, M23 family [Geotalea daltonii FRC-32]
MKVIFVTMIMLLFLPIVALADTQLPVQNGVITSGVGWRLDPFGSGRAILHHGIDIAVPVGTPVRATRKGQVVFSGIRGGYGSTVIVEHANGDRTLYGHNSLLRVKAGDMVESGTVVAFSGNTGRSTGPHVHFEQLPSGRALTEQAETENIEMPQIATSTDQRYRLEQQMDESVSSILRTINRNGTAGQGG